mmetsp:Transcript_11249/g.30103  ORF Transcript_11249/g.30103 Transcript_11249/m.30103 type:complete len:237 (+) Transcript_11249:744-1454(+)
MLVHLQAKLDFLLLRSLVQVLRALLQLLCQDPLELLELLVQALGTLLLLPPDEVRVRHSERNARRLGGPLWRRRRPCRRSRAAGGSDGRRRQRGGNVGNPCPHGGDGRHDFHRAAVRRRSRYHCCHAGEHQRRAPRRHRGGSGRCDRRRDRRGCLGNGSREGERRGSSRVHRRRWRRRPRYGGRGGSQGSAHRRCHLRREAARGAPDHGIGRGHVHCWAVERYSRSSRLQDRHPKV